MIWRIKQIEEGVICWESQQEKKNLTSYPQPVWPQNGQINA